ncbi:hypothetical protein GCM10017044_27960 [Kordiimonas sediminis]|uniref:DUF7832 domain-containing protein n=1 Tax=Kordiimonas sediminis TaxID=1735581 RepID=A0A919EAS3_9PROT|nr:hypothetical protein [Kordiimonas sediminis]GHF30958.1 hypothetical protein GCM10017044_27960 [Kordiimonas sediminis]
MKYDDASLHYGGEGFPSSSPIEYGGVHIGLFLKWCFRRGWIGDRYLDDPKAMEDVRAVVLGQMTGTDFLFKYCDGRLTNEDLSEAGNKFAAEHYNRILEKVDEAFHGEFYRSPEGALDFEVFAGLFNRVHRGSKMSDTAKITLVVSLFSFGILGALAGWFLSEGAGLTARILSTIGGELVGNMTMVMALTIFGSLKTRFTRHISSEADMEKVWDKLYPNSYLKQVHSTSFGNKTSIEKSHVAACFHCEAVFPASEVERWVEENEPHQPTALCPQCNIDAVIADADVSQISKELLHRMRLRWFGLNG